MNGNDHHHKSLSVLGIKVRDMSWAQAFDDVLDLLYQSDEQHIFAFLNANNANIAMKNAQYRRSLQNAIILPDGIGVDIATRLREGKTFDANLNGTDFIPALLVFAQKPLKVALIGSRYEVAQRAADIFRTTTPWHEFIVISDGYFDQAQSHEILARLEKEAPDILLVGMGTPHQENWVDAHIKPCHGQLVFTVGALFDFTSERITRAPLKWRKLRVEWLHRLLVEPSRLWRRYLLGIPEFLGRVLLRQNLNSSDKARNL